MAGRAIFKGVLRFEDTEVPVKLHTAVRQERVRFHLLHSEDEVRLQQRMYCSREGEPVPREERARGFETFSGQYVILDPEEVKEVRPDTDRDMEILHFVEEGGIDPRLFDRSYYLSPDGEENDYALLARALEEAERVAVCRWAMRGRSYLGFVKPRGELLHLTTLRYAHQLVPADSLDVEDRDVKGKELDTALDLIQELTSDFDPSRYRNEHQQELMRLIEKKAKGEEPEKKEAGKKRPTKPGELQEKLEASLEEARSGSSRSD